MNGNASGSAGLESADAGSNPDHPAGARGRALDYLAQAAAELLYLNKPEASIAFGFIDAAIKEIETIQEVEHVEAAGEG